MAAPKEWPITATGPEETGPSSPLVECQPSSWAVT